MFAMRPTGPPQLSLFGVPVRIEPAFWIITGLIGLQARSVPLMAGWVAIVGVSLLLHELGHAAAYIACGLRPAIVLHGFGGMTYAAKAPVGRWRSIGVSLAGPLLPLVAIGLPALYLQQTTHWALSDPIRFQLVEMAVWVNVWWSLLNLLPVVPLDGGHVVEQLIGRRAAAITTIVVAGPLAFVAMRVGLIFGVLVLGSSVLQAATSLRIMKLGRAGITVVRPTAANLAAPPAGPMLPADSAWAPPVRALLDGNHVAAMAGLEAAALAGPPPAEVVELLADEGVAPRLAERLLARPGDRSAAAVAELAGGLLAAGRFGPAGLVAERLATDARSAPLGLWAAAAASRAWTEAGDPDRAARWARIATERGAG